MEEQTYGVVGGDRCAKNYDYANDLYAKRAEELLNYDDYAGIENTEFAFGDGQNIETNYIAGDEVTQDNYQEYRPSRMFVQAEPRKTMTSHPPTYTSSYLPQSLSKKGLAKSSAYYPDEIGDYNRSGAGETINYQKPNLTQPHAYLTQDPFYTKYNDYIPDNLSKRRGYLNRLRDLHNARLYTSAPPQETLTTDKTYQPKTEHLTFGQMESIFMENYKMNLRKAEKSSQQAQNIRADVNPSYLNSTFPQEMCPSPRNLTKYEKKVDEESVVEGAKSKKDVQPTNISRVDYLKGMAYEKLAALKPRNIDTKRQNEQSDIEITYKNKDFIKSSIPEEAEQSDLNQDTNAESSTTIISQVKAILSDGKITSSSKHKDSSRSNRSKRSTSTVKSKKYEDIVKLQKSKCELFSIIYDGIQKCDVDVSPSKYNQDTDKNPSKASQTDQADQTDSSSIKSDIEELTHTDLISNMFKEYRGYHLQNILQEVRRLQHLEKLPQKVLNKHSL